MKYAIDAVLFDMDGLMFDSERLSDTAWRAVGPRFGVEVGPDEMALLRGTTREQGRINFKRRYGEGFPYDEAADEAWQLWDAMLEREVPVKRGLRELLAYLKQRGVKMAVASSTPRRMVERNLAKAQVREWFDAVVCGDMVTRSKPDPEIFETAARHLGVEPRRCLVLEDSYNGMRAGKAAGCVTVMVPDMDPATAEMRDIAAAILQNLAEVPAFLEQA